MDVYRKPSRPVFSYMKQRKTKKKIQKLREIIISTIMVPHAIIKY